MYGNRLRFRPKPGWIAVPADFTHSVPETHKQFLMPVYAEFFILFGRTIKISLYFHYAREKHSQWHVIVSLIHSKITVNA